MMKGKIIISAMLLISAATGMTARADSSQDRIAASQDGASPLLYTTEGREIPLIEPGSFSDVKECNVRGGLGNFLSKASGGQEVTVAFIGGSITQGDLCYRLQTSLWMERHWPEAKFRWINAGVAGTGTDLGAFRIEEQVLSHRPDLVFIEFAVNRGYAAGMEGMVRKIIKACPDTDICLIYTITGNQTSVYRKGDVPAVIKGLEEVAEHYGLPSVHLGMEAAALEESGKLLWSGTEKEAGDRTLFSHDGIHPIASGGNLYAAAIARSLVRMEAEGNAARPHSLKAPLIGDEWDDACMVRPQDVAEFDYTWKEIRTADSPKLEKFSGWFDTVMSSGKPEAYFSFGFEGDMIGFFDIGGPEAGQLEIIIDGELVRLKETDEDGFRCHVANGLEGSYTLNRFNRWCNNRYRGQYDVIRMEKGVHQVTVRISSQKPDKAKILGKNQQKDITADPQKYDKSEIWLGRILLRGKPVPCNRVKGVPKLAQQLKWDAKMERYEQQDELNPPKKDVILFIGSSTIENWKTVADDFPGKYILNRGVSGTKTIDMINYRERLISPYDPKQIFLYAGDNDIGYKWTPEEIMEQVRKLFSLIREEKPEAEIVLISIKPSPRRLKDKDRIEKTNAMLNEFASQQPNTAYADIYSAMLDGNGSIVPEYYREDGLHLTAEGYEVWRKVISNYIK